MKKDTTKLQSIDITLLRSVNESTYMVTVGNDKISR
jgi:hypothetical protein